MSIDVSGGGLGAGGGSGQTAQSGTVGTGDASIIAAASLEAEDTVEIPIASLVQVDGQPVPTGLDLVIATLDGTGNATKVADVITGDGATVYINEEGDPLASYTNTTGDAVDIAVFVDNGNFGAGSGDTQVVLAEVQISL